LTQILPREYPFSSARPQVQTIKGVPCLVLGAGGFLGIHLGRALVRAGAVVAGFGRSVRFPGAQDPAVDWVEGNFSDRGALERAVAESEIVFHLIGESFPEMSNEDPLAECADMIMPTLALLDICRAKRVRKIVYCSSGGAVYGISTTIPVPETALTNPISAYGIAKLTIEKYLALYRHLYGIDFQVLRLANPYGPYQSPLRSQGVVSVMIYRALRGEPIEIWGTGEAIRDYIHVEDAVSAFIEAARYVGPHKVMNVGSGRGRSVAEVAADVGEMLDLDGILKTYGAARKGDVQTNILDASLIRRELGWSPTVSWPDGLRGTASWIRDQFGL
jgi:UDP-glucose 4-epimerase